MAAPVAAQDQAEEPAEADASAPHLPADSMELGAKYIDMIVNYDAGDFYENLTAEAQENLGTVGDIMDRMASMFEQIGEQDEVISQRYWMRNEKPQYWHTAKFTMMDEPIVFRLVIEPDGKISGIGINPESQNPPVDDPDQHADPDS